MHGPPPGAPRVLRAFRLRHIRVRVHARADPVYVYVHVYVRRAARVYTCVCAYTRATRLRLRDATLRIYQYYFLQLIYYAAPATGPARHAARRIKPPCPRARARARHRLIRCSENYARSLNSVNCFPNIGARSSYVEKNHYDDTMQ